MTPTRLLARPLLCCLAAALSACGVPPAAPRAPEPIVILPWVLQEPAYIAAAASKLAYLKEVSPDAYAQIRRVEAFYRTQPPLQQLSARERLAVAVHVYEVAHGLIVPTHPSQYLLP
ncbi:hypothetical protein FOZ76_04760 [Verticiella sediminum]|uniref:Uncharacterized protein n=1 Tax=Verticiella sediminum TaxID=1247510 RepID=A0A556AYT7_9BURK|nr:hypothetical protein [Verticiella sediminum]TSH98099.1 hypothetical protein FOZ76_04760 [Verticiella sediminum]